MDKITCATCPYCVYESPFYRCGLDRIEDVTFDWKPLEIQPIWCKLREDERVENE